MRYLLVLLLFTVQTVIFGNATNDLQKSDVEKVLTFKKSSLEARNNVLFLYQGQYYDEETGLAYNRFRYYSPDTGTYISQDPIGLAGGMPNMYSYTHDSNAWVDQYGLYSDLLGSGMGHHLMPRSIAKNLGIGELSPNNALSWYPNNGVGTADLHKQLHRNLINEGIPYHGSKFKGSTDEFFDAAKKAYKDIDVKGYMKIPGTDNKLLKNVTPLEGIEKLQELHKKGKIPCK